ncbi:ArgP/LysG family DNA-binding transcriptional regulator [Ramlibacter sp. PS4R-6]|uniref:ArgP/LysG family DNA-binding transcriptional regulator n=1 Tax=Ramlibacter sp. PS4R-6 TaxID=3133438 RepID=UPI0030A2ABE7
MRNLDPLALECLVALAEEGSFQRAARRLSITQSAVSQRLWSLESNVGTVLIVRSRPVRATPAGQVLLRHAKHLTVKQADLIRELRDLGPTFTRTPREDQQISVAFDPDSVATWGLAALDAFSRDGLATEIIVDHPEQTHERLREGDVLGCVTTVDQAPYGCKAVALGRMHYMAVAGKDFAARNCPHGLTPQNFRSLKFIAHSRGSDVQVEFVSKALGLKDILLNQHFVPTPDGQLRAVLAGWGVSVLPKMLVEAMVRDGELVDIAPGVAHGVDLHWHSCNFQSEVIALLDAAVNAGARELQASGVPEEDARAVA